MDKIAYEKMFKITNYQINASQTTVRMAIIKKKKQKLLTMNPGEVVEKRESSYTVGRNSQYGEQCGDSLKN